MRTEDQVVELTEKLIEQKYTERVQDKLRKLEEYQQECTELIEHMQKKLREEEGKLKECQQECAELKDYMQKKLREEVGKLKEYQQECAELKERMQDEVGILSMEQLNKKVAEFNEHNGRMDMQQRRMFCLFLVFVVLFCPENAVGRGVLIAFISMSQWSQYGKERGGNFLLSQATAKITQ